MKMKSKPVSKITKADFIPLAEVIKKNMKRGSFRKAVAEEMAKRDPSRRPVSTT